MEPLETRPKYSVFLIDEEREDELKVDEKCPVCPFFSSDHQISRLPEIVCR